MEKFKVFYISSWFEFDQKWNLPPMQEANKPVFVLASIWRSGSTLVQRLLSSDPEIIIWGEPYGDAGILPGLANSARGLLREDWPHPMSIVDQEAHDELYQKVRDEPYKIWMANLYPKPEEAPVTKATWPVRSIEKFGTVFSIIYSSFFFILY